MTRVKCPWRLCKYNSSDMSDPQDKYGYCNQKEILLKGFTHGEVEYVECLNYELDADKCIIHTEEVSDRNIIDIKKLK